MRNVGFAIFACLLFVADGAAQTDESVMTPHTDAAFTGIHQTDVVPPAAAGPFMDPSTVSLAHPEPNCAPFRYIDISFISMRQTAPAQKQGLIAITDVTTPTLPVDLDIYRTGVVNTHFMAGIEARIGQWIDSERAIEVGVLYLDPFFYKREYLAFTSAGGTFGGASSFTVTFLPNDTALDWTRIYYQAEHWGIETNLRQRFLCQPTVSASTILGLRYHQIHERHNIDFAPVNTVGFNEAFDTGNDIFGVQVGGEGDWRVAEYVSLRGKACWVVGLNWQWDSIKGPAPGTGLLTGANNPGYHEELRFGNFGDFTLSLVGHLTPYIEASIGFRALAFGGVKRAANIFDLTNISNPELKSGQDSVLLYGFTAAVNIDY